MRFAVAATLLVQTLPSSATLESRGLQTTQLSRRKNVQKLLLQGASRTSRYLNGKSTHTSLRTHAGVLKNTPTLPQFVECDPGATQEENPDVGLLSSCTGSDEEYCVESAGSKLGGYCMSPHRNGRLLQSNFPPSLCAPDAEENECDCTEFEVDTGEGMFRCVIYDYTCFSPEVCGRLIVERSIIDDVDSANYCYGIIQPEDVEICYGTNNSPACSNAVDGVACDSCEVVDIPDDGVAACYEFDCTNTKADIAGSTCNGEFLIEGVFPGIFDTEPPTFVCEICGEGKTVTIPDAVPTIDGFNPTTCGELDAAAKNGTLLPEQCLLLPPLVEEPCGCMEVDGPSGAPSSTDAPGATPPTSARVCYTTTTDILNAQLQGVKDIVICPDTTIQIGIPASLEFNEFIGGDIPLSVIGNDVTIKCGEDGASANGCTLTGGFLQLAVIPNNPFSVEKVTANNMLIQGLTFTGALDTIDGFTTDAVIVSAPGENMIMEDCIFSNLQTDSCVAAFGDLPFSADLTLRNIIFSNVTYSQSVVNLRDQTMTIEDSVFQDLIIRRTCTSCNTVGVIRNLRGDMTVKDSTFTNVEIFTSVLYWSVFNDRTTLTYSGNTADGIDIFDEENRDPATYCAEGLSIDRVQDGENTEECVSLFDNITPAPVPSPTSPTVTAPPTDGTMTPTTATAPITPAPTSFPAPTSLPASTPMPVTSTLSPVYTLPPVDMSMSMDMSMDMSMSMDMTMGLGRYLRDLDEELDSEFGRTM